MSDTITRFTKAQRWEHGLTIVLFTTLSVTGLPQKFPDTGWARGLVWLYGGIESTRWIHRAAGILFSVAVAWHVGSLLIGLWKRTLPLSMVPTRKDLRDTWHNLGYYLGLRANHPRFDRFDYKQKFEYWGQFFGSCIMVATGFILYLPTLFTAVLPGQLVPAAKVAHSNEGLMAMLIIVIWHIYNAHLAPEVFPFDRTIFTGEMSRERMEHEHPLELERIEAQKAAPAPAPKEGA